nr:metal ABC transporter ATP-binding protein [Aureimonas populi]
MPLRPIVDALLTGRGLGVRRGGRWLVRHVDLRVAPGEIVTLIGPNGSGKSTTVKALLGIERPDEGQVLRRAGLNVGYVPQKLAVDATLPLDVERMMRLTRRLPERDLRAALEETGVPHLRKARMAELSGGEFQRVLLARAIAGRPELLVLDEPVQGVDHAGEISLYELIADIRRRLGCGILLVSHDLHIVMAQTDTVICLNGHVCCQGSPQSVAQSPEYVSLFGARGAGALALYRHDHDHAHLSDGRVVPVPHEAGCAHHAPAPLPHLHAEEPHVR